MQFLIALVGLGVAIDYSLLVVSRWREEIAHGHDNEEAVRISMRTAGHAVFASGVTVAISLIALVVIPVPLLRSMGFGGMLIPLCSVAVVLTLLPAMLAAVGPRVDIPHIRKEGTASRGWTAWARMIVRRPWLVRWGRSRSCSRSSSRRSGTSSSASPTPPRRALRARRTRRCRP